MPQLILFEKIFPIGNICTFVVQNGVVICLVPPCTVDSFAELDT